MPEKKLTPPPKATSAFDPYDLSANQRLLLSLTNNNTFDWSKATRTSPLGYTEAVYPNDSEISRYLAARGALATTYPNNPGDQTQGTNYGAASAFDPDTVGHERLHLAQFNLDVHPTVKQVQDALVGSAKRAYGDLGTDQSSPAWEVPAYAFSSRDGGPDQQQSFNNYINLIERLNPGKSHHLLAAAPPELSRGYLATGLKDKPAPNPVTSLLNRGKTVP